MNVLLVFVSIIVADYAWAKYIKHAAASNKWRAATWSAVLYAVGAVAIVNFTHNRWLLIPAVAGAFVGTALGVK